ncbi:hypothetical protein FQA39_LY15935 [Lamprigera yunnana]|nr:hypothetical protein FQA39_LY15935 [Lamprigera yunnana]
MQRVQGQRKAGSAKLPKKNTNDLTYEEFREIRDKEWTEESYRCTMVERLDHVEGENLVIFIEAGENTKWGTKVKQNFLKLFESLKEKCNGSEFTQLEQIKRQKEPHRHLDHHLLQARALRGRQRQLPEPGRAASADQPTLSHYAKGGEESRRFSRPEDNGIPPSAAPEQEHDFGYRQSNSAHVELLRTQSQSDIRGAVRRGWSGSTETFGNAWKFSANVVWKLSDLARGDVFGGFEIPGEQEHEEEEEEEREHFDSTRMPILAFLPKLKRINKEFVTYEERDEIITVRQQRIDEMMTVDSSEDEDQASESTTEFTTDVD